MLRGLEPDVALELADAVGVLDQVHLATASVLPPAANEHGGTVRRSEDVGVGEDALLDRYFHQGVHPGELLDVPDQMVQRTRDPLQRDAGWGIAGDHPTPRTVRAPLQLHP